MIDHRLEWQRTIALILPRGHEHSARIAAGVSSYAAECKDLTVFELPYEDAHPNFELGEISFDAAIFWASAEADWVNDLIAAEIPIVSCGTNWLDAGIPTVAIGWRSFSEPLATRLMTAARCNVGLVVHGLNGYSAEKFAMLEQLRQRLADSSFHVHSFTVKGLPSEERSRLFHPEQETEILGYLDSLPKPASIFCDDDYLAALVLRVAQHAGWRLPTDLAILGFGNFTISQVSSPSISTYEINGALVGRRAMQIVHQQLRDKASPTNLLEYHEPTYVERESFCFERIGEVAISEVNHWIRQEAGTGINVDDIARRLGTSRNTLNRRYQQEYGTSPGKAIRAVRTQMAKDLLLHSNQSIAKIGLECGFPEPANFVNFFKREVGTTPNEFRRAAQQDDRDISS